MSNRNQPFHQCTKCSWTGWEPPVIVGPGGEHRVPGTAELCNGMISVEKLTGMDPEMPEMTVIVHRRKWWKRAGTMPYFLLALSVYASLNGDHTDGAVFICAAIIIFEMRSRR